MLQPTLPYRAKETSVMEVWKGYNHNLRIGDGELYDMENLCSDHFPVLATRRKRGVYKHTQNAQGMIAKDALCYVDGDTLFFNGYPIEGLMLSDDPEDCPKQLVSMGAYIVILPDKKYFNTADMTDYGNIDVEFKTENPVAFTLCKRDGTDIAADSVGDNAPENAQDGMYWVDTSGSPHVLKKWADSTGEWVTVPTVYIKLSSPNLGKAFSENDGVTITGLQGVPLIDSESGEEIENDDISAIDGAYGLWGCGDDYIVIIGLLEATATIQNQITVSRKMPRMDFLFERDNRLWGCYYGPNADGQIVNELYASKLGDFKNWNCFMGLSTDSYRVSIGTDGQWTGAVNHKGYGLFFKEGSLHTVYGSYPANFTVKSTPCRGVQKGSAGSLVEVNEVLYYKSRTGVCAFDGSIPVGISDQLGSIYYSGAVAGGHGNKYYISMADEQGDYHLFVYDTAKALWHREDSTQATAFCSVKNELYYIDARDKQIKTMLGSGEEAEETVGWFAQTGVIGINTADSKYLTKLAIRLSMEEGAEVRAAVEYDSDGVWLTVCELQSQSLRTFDIPVRLRRCDHFRLRLSGIGQAQIYSITRTVERGSGRMNGSGRILWG